MIGSNQDSIPDLVEPLIGFRGWSMGDKHLYAPLQSTMWDQEEHAICTEDALHAAPQPNCKCGIYAYHKPEEMWRLFHRGLIDVCGIVQLWGACEIHETGVRAGRARIAALIDFDRKVIWNSFWPSAVGLMSLLSGRMIFGSQVLLGLCGVFVVLIVSSIACEDLSPQRRAYKVAFWLAWSIWRVLTGFAFAIKMYRHRRHVQRFAQRYDVPVISVQRLREKAHSFGRVWANE